jgi:AraC family ethanolamine operon transcriptional activator
MLEYGLAFSPPAVTVVEIDDPTSANAGIELLDQDAVQLTSMPLRVRRVIVRLEAATVVFHSTNVRVRSRASVNKNLIAYVAFGPRAQGSVNGLAVRPDLMLAVEPNAEVMFVTDTGWESIAFLVPPQDIKAHLTARRRDSEFRMPSGVETLHGNAERVCTLFDWGKRLVDTAARQPEIFNEGQNERLAAQVELLETLLAALGSSNDFEPSRNDRTRQAHSLIVKIAEDHALSRIDDRLHVTDLCRAARVSERTLEHAFKEIMGLTPVNYLIRLRLHRVRRELLAATQGSTTVTAEALKGGFWHFGEFSRAYKECFGELPSDTLRGRTAE